MIDKMEDESYKVPLFDGTNFSNWKLRMEVLLDEYDLLKYVDGKEQITDTEENKKKDRKCKSMIIQRIADSHLEYVKNGKTAKEVWETLVSTFERKGIVGQLYLRRKLLAMKYNDSGSLEKHFLEFDKNIRDLKDCGAKLEDPDIICHLLLTLPKSFDLIVTALDTFIRIIKVTLNFIKGK